MQHPNHLPVRALAAIGLALLGTTAQSQTSSEKTGVTLYGRVDVGLRNAPTDLSKNDDRQWSVGNSSAGRFGFIGKEDLGDGLAAVFRLESRFDADTGAVQTDKNATGQLFKQYAYVGLQSQKLGSITLGKQSSPADEANASRFEAFDGDSLAANGSRTARVFQKWNNAIYYATPRWSGVKLGVGAAPGEGVHTRAYGLVALYDQGPLSLSSSYQRESFIEGSPDKAGDDARTTVTLAGSYDFARFKLLGLYARSSKLNLADTGAERVLTLGTIVPLGQHRLLASLRWIDGDQIKTTGDHSSDKDSVRLGLGYQYDFSKRTLVALSLAQERMKTFAKNGSEASARNGTGYEVALRHKF
ncbi:porin [Rhodoferax sp. WC2427]|uniref:porin n=1 Tax=Rhodoferax sp. WC2427 TaxID=3234144 RepID=UPI0034665B0E